MDGTRTPARARPAPAAGDCLEDDLGEAFPRWLYELVVYLQAAVALFKMSVWNLLSGSCQGSAPRRASSCIHTCVALIGAAERRARSVIRWLSKGKNAQHRERRYIAPAAEST